MFKKKRRMRILGTVFFLSFLAGKLQTFERILLAENKKVGACVFLSARIFFLSFLAGNLKILNRILPRTFFHLNNQQYFN